MKSELLFMVDHHFSNASQGAIGLISTSAKSEEKDLEHHNIPASSTPTDPDTVQGKLSFESKCLACHSVGQGKKLGPDVAGVTKRRSDEWLTRWLKEPEKMLETDSDAQAMKTFDYSILYLSLLFAFLLADHYARLFLRAFVL